MSDEHQAQFTRQADTRWYTEPLLQFFVVGLVTFFLVPSSEEPSGSFLVPEERETVERRVQARLVESLNREPTPEERAEAFAWESDRSLLLDEAIRLGLHRDHPEVEQLLLEQMQELVGGVSREPKESELRDWYAGERQRKNEKKLGFTQLFMSPDATVEDVENVLHALSEGAAPEDLNVRIGRVQSARESTLNKRLPGPIVAHVLSKPLHRWDLVEGANPPLVVRVEERTEMEVKPFEAVRETVRQEWLAHQRREALRTWIRQRKGEPSD